MRNIFLTIKPYKYQIQNGKLILADKNRDYSVRISEIENIFVLSNSRFAKEIFDMTKKPVYKIDDFGNIKDMYLPKRRLRKLTQKESEKILKNILKINILQIRAYISNLSSFDRNFYRYLYSDELFKTVEDYFLEKIDVESLYKVVIRLQIGVVYSFLQFHRKYSSKRKENITMNLFHSLYISYITTYLINKNIDPNQDFLQNFKRKNYPIFSTLLFNLLKINAITLGDRVFNEILSEHKDFNTYRFGLVSKLTQTSKLIISKIFAERFIHNKPLRDKFDNFFEGLVLREL